MVCDSSSVWSLLRDSCGCCVDGRLRMQGEVVLSPPMILNLYLCVATPHIHWSRMLEINVRVCRFRLRLLYGAPRLVLLLNTTLHTMVQQCQTPSFQFHSRTSCFFLEVFPRLMVLVGHFGPLWTFYIVLRSVQVVLECPILVKN